MLGISLGEGVNNLVGDDQPGMYVCNVCMYVFTSIGTKNKGAGEETQHGAGCWPIRILFSLGGGKKFLGERAQDTCKGGGWVDWCLGDTG